MSAQPAAAEAIGNYVIEHALAQGSMGQVYVARHQLTYARVALKVLRSELAADAHAEERFLREVRAAAQIGHEGIVKVLDAGCDARGRLYLAMELLSGETLEERIAQKPGDRLALMRWIASALAPLAAAHELGIVHRDLKPANLFIARAADGSEQLKLLDFGLARDTRQKSRTETGVALGTPYYMSPEQAIRPKEVGPTSDVWALGVMMYEVLSGYMPFDGETLHAVVLHSTTRPHEPLAARRPELDAALCELVEDCLRKEPSLRPHDASALRARLFPLLSDARICRQLEQPLRAVASERVGRGSADPISYADTAITLPAPRIDESEASYASRRRSNAKGGMLLPVMLSALLLGGGAFGYMKYAPGTRWPEQHAAPATAPPLTAAAAAPGARAPAPTPPASAELQEPSAEAEAHAPNDNRGEPARGQSHHGAARDGRAQQLTATRPRSPTSRHPAALPKRAEPSHETVLSDLSAADAIPALDPAAVTPGEAPAEDVAWDQIDAQLRANSARAPEQDPAEEPAPVKEPASEPAPAIGPDEGTTAPAEPAPEVESLPPPEPPTSP